MHLRSDRAAGEAGTSAAPYQKGKQSVSGLAGLVAQRQADPESVAHLQRSVGNAAVAQLLEDEQATSEQQARSPVLDVVGHGRGEPLDAKTRPVMERALGADLGSVRVHADGTAAASAQTVQAHAYTVGEDIVFGAGQYQPGTPTGQRMLAHELTHVVQQRSGPVDGTPTRDGISVSDPSDRFERAAEVNADRIMAAGMSDVGGWGGASGGGALAQRLEEGLVQRAGEADEEDVQGAWVQRDQAEEEEEPAEG